MEAQEVLEAREVLLLVRAPSQILALEVEAEVAEQHSILPDTVAPE